jgi:surfeit locus 1 family protein
VSRLCYCLVLTLVAMPITSFALGTWQVYRLQWKKDLIDKYSNNLRQPAIILPKDVGDHTVEALDHRTVLVKGKFRHDQEMLVGPRTRDGVLGYHVLTPIERENGSFFQTERC